MSRAPVSLAAILFAAFTACTSAPATRPEHGSSCAGYRVVLGGDCSFARGVADRAHTEGWSALFSGSAESLERADLAIVNLESPLAPCLPGGAVNRPRLCGDPEAVLALASAGVDAVTLANNHALDAGEEGLRDTVETLAARGIAALGVGAATTGTPVAESAGDIAVVAANVTPPAHPPGSDVPIPSPSQVAEAVRAARKRDAEKPVLVVLHIGREMDSGAQPRDAAYARPSVRAGAAAVVMHGAHVLRPLVEEEGSPVHLGLGNLLFDQRDPRARRGALLELCFPKQGAARVMGVTCVDPMTSHSIVCEPAR